MRKATIMNRVRKAKQAGDEKEHAYWQDQLAMYKENRHAGRGGQRTYRVKSGDNLFTIAEEKYDDARYAVKIAQANKGIYQVSPGMVLRLPPKEEESPYISMDEWNELLKAEGKSPEGTGPSTGPEAPPPVQPGQPEPGNEPTAGQSEGLGASQTAISYKGLSGTEPTGAQSGVSSPTVAVVGEDNGAVEVDLQALGEVPVDINQYHIPSFDAEGIALWKRDYPEEVADFIDRAAAYYGPVLGLPDGNGATDTYGEINHGEVRLPTPTATPTSDSEPQSEDTDNLQQEQIGDEDYKEEDYYSIFPSNPLDMFNRRMVNEHGLFVATDIVDPDDTFKWDSTYIVFKKIDGYNYYVETNKLQADQIIDLEGVEVPAIMTAAGISVQSWFLSQIWDKKDDGEQSNDDPKNSSSGYGPAQVSDQQMQLYGLGDLDQMDPEVAKQAMAVRLAAALKTCENLAPIDKLIIAGIAQNGTFFDYDIFATAGNKNFASDSDAIPGNVDWESFLSDRFKQPSKWNIYKMQADGLHYDTQFMVRLYLKDMLELHKQGWELPYGVKTEDIEKAITYMGDFSLPEDKITNNSSPDHN